MHDNCFSPENVMLEFFRRLQSVIEFLMDPRRSVNLTCYSR